MPTDSYRPRERTNRSLLLTGLVIERLREETLRLSVHEIDGLVRPILRMHGKSFSPHVPTSASPFRPGSICSTSRRSCFTSRVIPSLPISHNSFTPKDYSNEPYR